MLLTNRLKNVSGNWALGLSMALILAGGQAPLQADEAPAGETTAQGEEALVTDRPDFTESAQTVLAGRVQVEGGVTFERAGSARMRSVGEVLVRVGAGDRAEIRLGVPSYLTVSDGGRTSGLDDAFLGAKFRLNGPDSKTGLALLAGSALPTGSRRVAEHRYQPEAVLAADFPDFGKFSLAANLGGGRMVDGGQRFTQLWGSVSLGRELTEKTGAFFELFAFNRDAPGGSSRKYFDTGLTHQITPDFQLDARIGFGLNNNNGGGGPDYFYGFGVSRRF